MDIRQVIVDQETVEDRTKHEVAAEDMVVEEADEDSKVIRVISPVSTATRKGTINWNVPML